MLARRSVVALLLAMYFGGRQRREADVTHVSIFNQLCGWPMKEGGREPGKSWLKIVFYEYSTCEIERGKLFNEKI